MKRSKLFVVSILLIFLCVFSIGYKKSFGIYRDTLNTKVYLSVLDPSSNIVVTFDSQGGSQVSPMLVALNTSTGVLPTPTRANYNFLGWYKSDGVTKADPNENLLANVTYYAHWAKIVCKKVTDSSKLHTETCLGSSGCLTSGTGFSKNDIITYGTIFDSAPVAGDAYDCDVDNDGVYDPQDPNNSSKYTERFYFVRQKENVGGEDTAVLSYYTTIDDAGAVDSARIAASVGDDTVIHSTGYVDALNYLPKSSAPTNPESKVPVWDNPKLVDFDGNGKITRFLALEDYEAVCGSPHQLGAAYFNACQQWFFFENSRFQASNISRSGIWLEMNDDKYYRLQTGSVNLESPKTGATSSNMVRPVIEIPMTSLDGYQNKAEYTVSFNTHGGSAVESYVRYSGQEVGTLPTTTREHYNFDGWYENYDNDVYTNLVTAQTVVTGNVTYHAKWTPKPTATVTFNANGGTVEGESTLDVTVDIGDTINPLPVAVRSEHSFAGWYKNYENNVYSNKLSTSDVIESNMTVYAKWQSANHVAMVGENYYDTLEEAIAATSSTKTKVTILKDITLTEAVTIPSGKWVELDLGSYAISGTTNLITNNGKLDIINGTIEATQTTEANTIITNNSGATLNISGGTLNNASSNGTKEFLVINNNGGTLNITGGTLTSRGQSAAINMKANGTINVSGGVIKNTSPTKGQAIYMDHGTLNISGDSYIENTSGDDATVGDKNKNRAAVDNFGGTLNITGGTIVSKGWSAVIARNANGTTTIGTNDETVDITTPVLRGVRYGLERTDGTVNVYDGIFESLDNVTAYSGTISEKANYDWTNSNVDVDGVTYHATYFNIPSFTVKFFPENGDSTISITVDNGDAIGTQMPSNPTKTGYYFDGWYDGNTLVTSQTTVTKTINAYARWVQSISNATIASTLSVEKDSNKNISITGTDIESVTYTSSDDSIATVDANGKVTGVAVGSATITITGAKSGDTKTVTVTVTPIMHTVTFLDSDNQTELYTRSVEENTAIGAGMPNNPTKENYVFNAWYINGNSLYEFTNAAVVTDDITVVANWKEKVSFATMSTSPSPFEIVVGNTGQITLSATSQNGVVEDYTITSNNTNVAIVNQSGVVTAVAIGNTDIVITGSLSGDTNTVHVVVKPETHSVTFKDGDDVITSVQVADGTSIGNNMPSNPTKENYIFDAWYINGDSLYEFTTETVVTGDMVVVASWSPSIRLATIPASLAVVIGDTSTITVTGPSGMEGYTFSSSDTSIATVDNSGVVTGVALGTVDITVTGSRSNATRTVEVTVSSVPLRTITFMDDDNTTVIDTVQIEDGETIASSDGVTMPTNPSRQNYIFGGWYINGNSLYPFTSSTEVSGGDITVVANWMATIGITTVNTTPDPLRIMVGSTGQINVVSPSGGSVEPHTFSSNNTNIVSVDSDGVAHGEDIGTVTITITGTESHTTKTVQAEVVNTYNVIFNVDDDVYDSKDVMPNDALGELPTPPTKSGYVFVGWYTTFAEPYTTRIDEDTIIDGDKTYYARWASDNYQAEMNNNLYTTVQLAINDAPTSGKTTVRLLKDVTYTTMINLYDTANSTPQDNQSKNIVLDLNNFSITNNTTYTLRTRTTMEIKNGTIIGKAGSGAIETNGANAILTLRNVNMNITGTRQAIYNDGGAIDIYGGNFSAKATYEAKNKRGTIQNQSGTITIHDGNISSSATGTATGIAVTVNGGVVNVYGGTISATGSNTGYGLYVNGGTANIGEKDKKHDISKLTIQGKTNGVYALQNIKFYDGVIEAISTSNAMNDESKISDYETGAIKTTDTENIGGVDYNRLYYVIAATKYHIDFNANDGTVTPLYKEFDLNEEITSSDLPTPTRGVYEFDGWYTDSSLTEPFATFTPDEADTVTYYAKWSFISTLTPVSHNVLSNAMVDYFGSVSSWVAADPTDPSNDPNDDANASNGYDNGHHLFKNSISQVFTDNGCSSCQADNSCSNPAVGTYCDQPKGYDTALTDDLNVYLYTNGEKDSEIVSYVTSTDGKIYNMIPGKTYYWESATDNTKYGVVTATGQRRTLKTAVRNLRDFGGLSVSYVDPTTHEAVNGTIKYGKMYRGAQITSAQGVTDLYKLGVTREVDVRGNGDGNQTYKLTNYDTGTSTPNSYTDIEITNYLINPVATPYITKDYEGNYDALKSAMRAVMEAVVFNDDNIYFHCTIGTDRTGTLAYFLEGLLGVSEEDRLRDYELSYFYGLTNRTRFHDSSSWSSVRPRFYSMYRSYPTNTDIYNYYKYKTHTVDSNNPNDLSDDELLSRFRDKMIS